MIGNTLTLRKYFLWNSHWFCDYNYYNLLFEDIKVINYLQSIFSYLKYPTSNFIIRRYIYKVIIQSTFFIVFWFKRYINKKKLFYFFKKHKRYLINHFIFKKSIYFFFKKISDKLYFYIYKSNLIRTNLFNLFFFNISNIKTNIRSNFFTSIFSFFNINFFKNIFIFSKELFSNFLNFSFFYHHRIKKNRFFFSDKLLDMLNYIYKIKKISLYSFYNKKNTFFINGSSSTELKINYNLFSIRNKHIYVFKQFNSFLFSLRDFLYSRYMFSKKVRFLYKNNFSSILLNKKLFFSFFKLFNNKWKKKLFYSFTTKKKHFILHYLFKYFTSHFFIFPEKKSFFIYFFLKKNKFITSIFNSILHNNNYYHWYFLIKQFSFYFYNKMFIFFMSDIKNINFKNINMLYNYNILFYKIYKMYKFFFIKLKKKFKSNFTFFSNLNCFSLKKTVFFKKISFFSQLKKKKTSIFFNKFVYYFSSFFYFKKYFIKQILFFNKTSSFNTRHSFLNRSDKKINYNVSFFNIELHQSINDYLKKIKENKSNNINWYNYYNFMFNSYFNILLTNLDYSYSHIYLLYKKKKKNLFFILNKINFFLFEKIIYFYIVFNLFTFTISNLNLKKNVFYFYFFLRNKMYYFNTYDLNQLRFSFLFKNKYLFLLKKDINFLFLKYYNIMNRFFLIKENLPSFIKKKLVILPFFYNTKKIKSIDWISYYEKRSIFHLKKLKSVDLFRKKVSLFTHNKYNIKFNNNLKKKTSFILYKKEKREYSNFITRKIRKKVTKFIYKKNRNKKLNLYIDSLNKIRNDSKFSIGKKKNSFFNINLNSKYLYNFSFMHSISKKTNFKIKKKDSIYDSTIRIPFFYKKKKSEVKEGFHFSKNKKNTYAWRKFLYENKHNFSLVGNNKNYIFLKKKNFISFIKTFFLTNIVSFNINNNFVIYKWYMNHFFFFNLLSFIKYIFFFFNKQKLHIQNSLIIKLKKKFKLLFFYTYKKNNKIFFYLKNTNFKFLHLFYFFFYLKKNVSFLFLFLPYIFSKFFFMYNNYISFNIYQDFILFNTINKKEYQFNFISNLLSFFYLFYKLEKNSYLMNLIFLYVSKRKQNKIIIFRKNMFFKSSRKKWIFNFFPSNKKINNIYYNYSNLIYNYISPFESESDKKFYFSKIFDIELKKNSFINSKILLLSNYSKKSFFFWSWFWKVKLFNYFTFFSFISKNIYTYYIKKYSVFSLTPDSLFFSFDLFLSNSFHSVVFFINHITNYYMFYLRKKYQINYFIDMILRYLFKNKSFFLYYLSYYLLNFLYLFYHIELTLSKYINHNCFLFMNYSLRWKYSLNSAKMWCEYIAYFLKKKMTIWKLFHFIKKQQKLEKSKMSYDFLSKKDDNILLHSFKYPLKGIRIIYSGNLKKAKRKRHLYYYLWLSNNKYTGKMPLKKFKFYIDYYSTSVFLKRSNVGIKFWLLFNII